MRCKNVKERLDDHVDGLLAAREAEAVRDHLDACADCRETSLALRASTASLSSWQDVDPPAECFGRIMCAIDALPPETLARPARRGAFSFLQRAEPIGVARTRWMMTSGLAAAAAMMAAVLVTRTEPQRVRRLLRLQPAAATTVAGGPWGYDFDNSLLYHGDSPVAPRLTPARYEFLDSK
jgi:anti-sigma factor RsiW